MRHLSVLAIALLLVLAPAGIVAGQAPQLFPRQPHDLSAEYYPYTGAGSGPHAGINDPNGLPPPSNSAPTLILDSKGRTFISLVGSTHHNEMLGPILWPGTEPGSRTKSVLFPGLVTFHAWYGEFQDKDGDKVIDASTDASDEWTGYTDNKNDAPRNTLEMLGYIYPGYHPVTTSDYYLLGDHLIPDQIGGPNETALEKIADFQYTHGVDGNYTGASSVPMPTGTLFETIEVHTIANGVRAGTTDTGYACGSDARCRIDIDRYDVVDPRLGELYTLASAGRQLVEWGYVNPAFQPVADVVNLYGGAAIDATINFERTENGVDDPYASMTPAHGVPSPYSDRYDYASGPHAWLDVQPWNYYTEPNFVGTLAVAPIGVTDLPTQKAKGLAPHMFGIQGDTGIWWDRNADGGKFGYDDPGEYQGTCAVIDAAGLNTNLTATVSPVKLHADGSTTPATWNPGVYILREDNAADDVDTPLVSFDLLWWDEAAADVLDNFVVDRLVTGSTPIEISLRCEEADPGDWFANEVFYLPAGTYDFALKIETPRNLFIQFLDSSGSTRAEEIVDVDVYESWNDV